MHVEGMVEPFICATCHSGRERPRVAGGKLVTLASGNEYHQRRDISVYGQLLGYKRRSDQTSNRTQTHSCSIIAPVDTNSMPRGYNRSQTRHVNVQLLFSVQRHMDHEGYSGKCAHSGLGNGHTECHTDLLSIMHVRL